MGSRRRPGNRGKPSHLRIREGDSLKIGHEEKRNTVIAHGRIAESVSDSRYFIISEALPSEGYLLMFDLSITHILSSKFWFYPRKKRILFLVEPKPVFPHQYWLIWRIFFEKCFSRYSNLARWEPGYVFEDELSKLGALWGGVRNPKPSCVISNQLKFTPGGNYGLRREILELLHDSNCGLELAGRGWNRGDSRLSLFKELVWTVSALEFPMVSDAIHYFRKPRSSNEPPTGVVVQSSIEFLANYEIAVVIENETGTYCSEKLADAIMAGCKILYIGGELQHDFKESYPIEVVHSRDEVLEAMLLLNDQPLPDRTNQAAVTGAVAQLASMSISRMVSRTKLLLANRP